MARVQIQPSSAKIMKLSKLMKFSFLCCKLKMRISATLQFIVTLLIKIPEMFRRVSATGG
jgi:hypothetical protein